jgi:hypothetical protein
MPKNKNTQKTKITQKELMDLYREQERAKEERRLAAASQEKITTAGEELRIAIQRHKAEVEEGPAKPHITKIIRRVPHYKQETYQLAVKAGLDPDAYLEECRNRGNRITYFRLKLKIVE